MNTQFLGIGSRVKHPEYGDGVIIQVKSTSYLITFIDVGTREITRDFENFEVIDALEPPDDLISFENMEIAIKKILREYSDLQEVVPIGEKWKGGRLILKPGNDELKSYEIPVSTFFHKIVMVRDRLRVMEQKINASKLDDQEKVNLQQYISRIYGSLTSFNVLFKNRHQDFTGMR